MNVLDLQRNETFKPIIRMATAAAIAGLIVFAASAAPKADVPEVADALPALVTKGDRLPVPVKGAACSKHGWPDLERSCQFDLRKPANEALTVRVLALR
jgi:hypothetical protein